MKIKNPLGITFGRSFQVEGIRCPDQSHVEGSQHEHRDRRIGGKGFQWWVDGADRRPANNEKSPRESGAWRLEVHPAAPAGRQHLTHAFLVADPAVTKMPETQALPLRDGWHGAHVSSAPEVVLVVADGDAPQLPLRYEVATALPCVHVVVGLDPGRVVEVSAGGTSRRLQASGEGVVSFHDTEIGAHVVTVGSTSMR